MSIDHRLTTKDMAEFVANGFLRFEAIVPDELNQRALVELERLNAERLRPAAELDALRPPASGTPLDACYPEPSVIGEFLRLPFVRGIITSLVGAAPEFDHDWVHHIPAGGSYVQPLHADANSDTLDATFDVQLFWFCSDVAAGEGGTRYVPGTHLTRVRASGLGRYQHIVGEKQVECQAGSVYVFHHGLWHAGQPNPGSRDRWMYKIRLNPIEPQIRLWNTEDFGAVHNSASDHIFARVQEDGVGQTFRRSHPWMSLTDYRNDQMQRALLWRYLSGDPRYDVDYYLTRLEQRTTRAGADR